MLTTPGPTQSTNWLTDIHTIIGIIAIVLMGLMSFIGYKVHSILFDLKMPERMASLEGTAEDHEKRIDKVEKKVFGI